MPQRLGLPVADKPDSQEICFVPEQRLRRVRDARRPSACRPAAPSSTPRAACSAVTTACTATPSASGRVSGSRRPSRSTSLTSARRTRGSPSDPRADLERISCEVDSVNWVSGEVPKGPIRTTVQIRHRHEPASALVTPREDGGVHVVFDAPERAITPGQAAVFYEGDEVVGGGWIASAK